MRPKNALERASTVSPGKHVASSSDSEGLNEIQSASSFMSNLKSDTSDSDQEMNERDEYADGVN